jgi:pimeloyl-ACP methyl ester carboxylesterase
MTSFPDYWNECEDILPKPAVSASVVRACDGYPLYVYEMGRAASTIVIANAVGLPFLLLGKVAQLLSAHYRVVSWEPRGAPFLGDCAPNFSLTPIDHARDLRDVLTAIGVRNYHLVGWCSGAYVITLAIKLFRLSPRSMFLIAPSGIGTSTVRNQYREVLLPILLKIASVTNAKTDQLCRFIRETMHWNDSDRTSVRFRLTSLNYRDANTTRAYAKQMKMFFDALVADGSPMAIDRFALFDQACTSTPTAIIHCLDDEFVPCEESVAAARRNSSVRLAVRRSGGHFVHCTDYEQVGADILTFLRLHAHDAMSADTSPE